MVEEPIPKNSPSESAESDSQSGQDAGFTRYQNDSSREALEERIREEIERRRAYQQNQQ